MTRAQHKAAKLQEQRTKRARARASSKKQKAANVPAPIVGDAPVAQPVAPTPGPIV